MTIQGLEQLQALREHHLPNMHPALKRALLLKFDGEENRAIAEREHVSEATIKQRLSTASAEIAMCLARGDRVTGEMRGGWTNAHLECCLGDALAQIEREAG